MFYEKKLDVFLAAAESGSFNKTAERLYLTHTAVMKQIEQLEKELGVTLFERNSRGLVLTEAGSCLRAELPQYLQISQKLEEKVRSAGNAKPEVIRVGVSLLYPGYDFMELWQRMEISKQGWKIQMVPIVSDYKRYAGLNREYDLLVGPYNAQKKVKEILFLPIGSYAFSITMPGEHRLAKRRKLQLSELEGETLLMMRRGSSAVNDEIRTFIEQKNLDIQIEDIDFNYDTATFNQCAEEGRLLLALECWNKIHPSLKNVVLDGPWRMPYGLLIRKDAPEKTVHFLEEFRSQMMIFDAGRRKTR